jgi:carbonic anhydrase
MGRNDPVDPAPLLQLLADGNQRHARGAHRHPHQDVSRRVDLASGQRPWAAILGCSDSRVPPEIVFDQGLGDLFVVRTAGHVCDAAVTASLSYAVVHLHVPLVVVLGHGGCGAVQAALNRRPAEPADCLCTAIEPAIAVARLGPGDLSALTVRFHVQRTVEHVRGALPGLPRADVVGAVYDFASGLVEFLDLPSPLDLAWPPGRMPQ